MFALKNSSAKVKIYRWRVCEAYAADADAERGNKVLGFMRIVLPEKVKLIIDELNRAGFEGYAVGGCVRDSMLGKMPKDWDVTTNASPEEIKSLFKRTVDTGIEHGTVTVLLGDEGFEVTTYRIDGKYEDNRHPSEVKFTKSLSEDLLRRDFTINAMAYNEKDGIVDLFGGEDDLKKGIIRAVGNPRERFSEDALRIMRAARFASVLGFEIEEETEKAMAYLAENLKDISAERIREELFKLIMGKYPEKILIAADTGILDVVFPEFMECVGCMQENKYHNNTVAEHIIDTVRYMQAILGLNGYVRDPRIEIPYEYTEKEKKILVITMLFHDIGKPRVKFMEGDRAHFWGHQKASAEMAHKALQRLKCDNDTVRTVTSLVTYHDVRFTWNWERGSSSARKLANRVGEDNLKLLVAVQYADIFGQAGPYLKESLEEMELMQQCVNDMFANNDPFCLKDLAVTGRDLIDELGMSAGKDLGVTLNWLLDKVIEKPEINTREILLGMVKERYLDGKADWESDE